MLAGVSEGEGSTEPELSPATGIIPARTRGVTDADAEEEAVPGATLVDEPSVLSTSPLLTDVACTWKQMVHVYCIYICVHVRRQ